jgi:hypothetical protein
MAAFLLMGNRFQATGTLVPTGRSGKQFRNVGCNETEKFCQEMPTHLTVYSPGQAGFRSAG